jgi:hypothetical protein
MRKNKADSKMLHGGRPLLLGQQRTHVRVRSLQIGLATKETASEA